MEFHASCLAIGGEVMVEMREKYLETFYLPNILYAIE
jgi:hypothetical protein